MTAKSIMFMGTGSDVGKSLIVAGLARLFSNRGLRVAPFKPQNMSNNAAVTIDGGEIGRAQFLQAQAARAPATVHMNPVLLKPEAKAMSQIVVQGKRVASMSARDFFANRAQFMSPILESFATLKSTYDLVLVEGAGSPAEINLRDGDLANFGFARAANVPAILIGDIHRGGVMASIVGTLALLSPEDKTLLKGFLINKFHGDPTLFDDGVRYLETSTQISSLGVIPYLAGAETLPAEDTLALEKTATTATGKTKICVLRLPRIANFDDLDPLRLDPEVTVQFINQGSPIPGDAKLVIIPGSKTTIADLDALRHNGWDIDLQAHYRRGGHILGLCGGYQILGNTIHDPEALEGTSGSIQGLGLLNIDTILQPDKSTRVTTGTHAATHTKLKGYEIHLGRTTGPDCERPFAYIETGPDGATNRDGRIVGTYLHGCFASDEFRAAYLKHIGSPSTQFDYDKVIDDTLNQLAQHLEDHVDIQRLMSMAHD